ncbi:MAG: NgoFVII family restriction endonuclease [Chloroflexi bacterium]|nr:NgoFVII family restriction endonuclease [Chloroflexota bacterium]
MPNIYDNIDLRLLPRLQQTLSLSYAADFCVGYLNLRGWRGLSDCISEWPGGEGRCVRLLVGMQRLPREQLRILYRHGGDDDGLVDNETISRLRKRLAEELRDQLTIGMPTDADEAGLRRFCAQLKARQVVVKLFLRHPLHAKLYLCRRDDPISPLVGYLGSSNLTMAGLSKQGELNVDVLDHDACHKLSHWFEKRWADRGAIDITDDLIGIIEQSWAREEPLPPYHIYIKMAYHLSQEARAGLSEFRIPAEFRDRLFPFQKAAVQIAAHHLNVRGGVLIGDVVGLGKTLMATAVARIFEDDQDLETLIICPKNLVSMWESYRDQYRLRARVLSMSRVLLDLDDLRRYRLVVIDESHNLRNREGKRFRAIQEYVRKNDSRCILLSATPYNKTYLDLSNQLRLFVADNVGLGIRPERLLRDPKGREALRKLQSPPNSLAAFDLSFHPDDWRDLMRLYMIRRTRSFIVDNYAETDVNTGRKYLTMADGRRSYFPERVPKRVDFDIRDDDPNDQYARLYSDQVVSTIDSLALPRYGLGTYVDSSVPASKEEERIIADLSRAGKRLMGFCRTNLFKRLESSGAVFLESIDRHILRNHIFLHALDNSLPLPIGTQDAALLDTRLNDEDTDRPDFIDDLSEGEDEPVDEMIRGDLSTDAPAQAPADYAARAALIYRAYATLYQKRFKWLPARFFHPTLAEALRADADRLRTILAACGPWDPSGDTKLEALAALLQEQHPTEKVLVFTQFADTVHYLGRCLEQRGVRGMAGVVGGHGDPTHLAHRFSPVSNEVRDRIPGEDELRILVATDVLSEGQNLQDGAIVVNYDLPWAIIRLIQRAGRVDRIGQQSDRVLCYSFLPAEGVERILRLRRRLRQRLRDNAEVIGTDEAFFEDEMSGPVLLDLYNEKAGLLDGEEDRDVDLASYAYQIWKNATDCDPSLAQAIAELPAVVYSTKAHTSTAARPEGALVYVRTGEGNDTLAWMDGDGQPVTESQYDILRAAECPPDEPALPRLDQHHTLVEKAVAHIAKEERSIGGRLGPRSGARYRTYERLDRHAQQGRGTIWITDALERAIDDIYRYPLTEAAREALNRQLRSGIDDAALADLVVSLRDDGRLCLVEEEAEDREPTIVCSLGLRHV